MSFDLLLGEQPRSYADPRNLPDVHQQNVHLLCSVFQSVQFHQDIQYNAQGDALRRLAL